MKETIYWTDCVTVKSTSFLSTLHIQHILSQKWKSQPLPLSKLKIIFGIPLHAFLLPFVRHFRISVFKNCVLSYYILSDDIFSAINPKVKKELFPVQNYIHPVMMHRRQFYQFYGVSLQNFVLLKQYCEILHNPFPTISTTVITVVEIFEIMFPWCILSIELYY